MTINFIDDFSILNYYSTFLLFFHWLDFDHSFNYYLGLIPITWSIC